MEELDVERKVILKWNCRNRMESSRIGFIWYGMGKIAELL
jgi:hypothetical protein